MSREQEADLYVSPEGDDDWSGERPEPTDDGTDGPFETVERARRAVRERKDDARIDGEVTVHLRGGTYRIEEPLTFGPEDAAPVTYAAYPGEEPVISGGRAIDGWEATTVNGVDAWRATVPAVRDGDWYPRQLFVDGERRPRPRLPDVGDLEGLDEASFHRMADVPGTDPDDWIFDSRGATAFEFAPGDVENWHNPTDVEVVALHYWIEERFGVADVDVEANRVTFDRPSAFSLTTSDDREYPRYYVENVFEALSEPGEWYLDRETGECWYVPKEGEEPETTTVTAPVTSQLLRVEGDPDAGEFVEFLRFEGLQFRHGARERPEAVLDDWPITGTDAAVAVQAANNVPGTVAFRGARNCALEDCTVANVGWYGVGLNEGCRGNRIVGCEVADTGAGGVTVRGSGRDGSRAARTGNNRVTDNHLHHGGRVYHSAVGILARNAFGNRFAHNHVHDYFYTGISCGWTWGYDDCVDRDNRIEANHIHDLGAELLSDMGGIYTLGVQPGTVLRENHIHDVAAWAYGGWAIYPDEGSSHLVVEGNVCHDTNKQAFNQHYGRENLVRNNVFAFGGESQISLGRAEDHRSYTFERNVVVTDGQPVFRGGYGWDLSPGHVESDCNVFWDVEERPLVCGEPEDDERGRIDFEAWRERGNDRHSVVADPGFADVESRDLSLAGDSPAREFGIDPVDVDAAGPRPPGERD